MNREDNLKAVRENTEPWDLIVIGGGATGAGCCLDAASRGLKVLLVEQSDFGKGTSSRSTKLVHGGVRYLEQGSISLVREALRERGRLRINAPDQVMTRAFVVPCYSLWERIYYTAGLKVYDLLSGKLSFGKSVPLNRNLTLKALPNIRQKGLRGGVRYFDGQFDDTRLLISLLTTAAASGAVVLNYARVSGLTQNDSGLIDGVVLVCAETGEKISAKAKVVINATGAFTDSIRRMSNENALELLACSQGIHLVFENRFLDSDTALMIPKTSDGRVLFAIPFYGRLLVGTTESAPEDTIEEPRATENEIQFILETCAEYFNVPPKREDIKSAFAGIRPLVADNHTDKTASLSRGHVIEIDRANLVTIAGGKWTTYRNMSEDAVDKAIATAGLDCPKSETATKKLVGDIDFEETGLEEKISQDFEWKVADIVKAVRFEMARTVEDVLARRTRLLFLDAAEAVRVAPFVAGVMASELGESSEWIDGQIAEFSEIAKNYGLNASKAK
jgi:glycerol-3-phosphate dehydrogenase